MIQKQQIKQYLIQVLNNPQVVSGGNELACSCPFCGEQRPKLYIGPFDDTEEQIRYHCFKCKTSGVVNEDFLYNYGISSIDEDIIKSNKGNSYKSKGIDRELSHNLTCNNITINQLSDYKLQYINNRLGTKFSYQDCINNKIILNINDLLQENNIRFLTRHPDTIEQLNSYFIGFLSRSNSGLNMRNLISGSYAESKLQESLRQKYINYKIFKETVNNDFYILPTVIDTTKHLKVYIAEGPFDVLGIKYNLIKQSDNCIYIAGKGKAYEKALLWVVKTLTPYDIEIHYFPDKDVPDKFIHNIINSFKPFGYTFYIHRNVYKNEKDYGVPEWRINDMCWKI